MRRTVTVNQTNRSAMTLVEMLVFLLLLISILMGVMCGGGLGAIHGKLMGIVGGVVGAILGGIGAAVFMLLLMLLLMLPFELISMVKGALEPAELVCKCAESTIPAPEHLVPNTPFEEKVISESRRLKELSEYWQDSVDIESILAERSLANERIALAASLSEPAAKKYGLPAVKPMLSFKYTRKWPRDIRTVLSCGLPPKLCLTWALLCVARLLPTFEREFHQDTRPRQVLGAALMFLEQGNEEALALCRKYLDEYWTTKEAGCRVLQRSLKERAFREQSKGEQTAWIVYLFVRSISVFAEPSDLWIVCSAKNMINDSAQSRCELAQPGYRAGDIAYDTAPMAN